MIYGLFIGGPVRSFFEFHYSVTDARSGRRWSLCILKLQKGVRYTELGDKCVTCVVFVQCPTDPRVFATLYTKVVIFSQLGLA